jgi:hypothetical protein
MSKAPDMNFFLILLFWFTAVKFKVFLGHRVTRMGKFVVPKLCR